MKKKTKENPFERIACCLQGGGAMGAYQLGVLKAIFEANFHPDWYIGTSIGAINSAIAAGNEPKKKIEKIVEFWETISTPPLPYEALLLDDALSKRMHHLASSQSSILMGQPGFYQPRLCNLALLGIKEQPDKLSYYDTSPLKKTLESLIDFDRLNDGKTRLSVGAVDVCSGEMHYFDTDRETIEPEHIMASGALPPGFPAIKIKDKYYWDGGLSSNSPISYVLASNHSKSLLCFMVHLFDSYGLEPNSFDDIEKRKKDIEYFSRFDKIIYLHQIAHDMRYAIHELSQHIPESERKKDHVKQYLEYGWDRRIALVRYLYKGDKEDLSSKDYEFSKKSIREHIDAGYLDGFESAKKAPWLELPDVTKGFKLYDMAHTIKEGKMPR